MSEKIIRVAGVAIIDPDSNQLLAAKRNQARLGGGMWEFPGGKVEPDETAREAAVREIREEFHDEIKLGPQVGETISYEYDFGKVELTVFFAKLLTQNLDLVAHSQIEWVSADQVKSLDWLPADAPLVEILAQTDFSKIRFE